MSQQIKLWLPLRKAIEQVDGLCLDGAYKDIRKGSFPFRTEVIAGRIHVSARDLGLIPETNANEGTRDQEIVSQATA